MQAEQASESLQLVEELQRRTRSTLKVVWFPLVVFGVLFLASAPLVALSPGPAIGAYWAVAGSAGGITVGRYYRRREQTLGLEGPWVPYVVTAIAIMVGCFVAVAVGRSLDSEIILAIGPSLVVSAGYVVFSLLDRDARLGAVAVGLAAVSVGLAATGWDPQRLAAALAVIYGGAFVATGLAYRRREQETT